MPSAKQTEQMVEVALDSCRIQNGRKMICAAGFGLLLVEYMQLNLDGNQEQTCMEDDFAGRYIFENQKSVAAV